ncbi:glutamine synthetase [Lentzea fradiae]|uniref:Glutamine synthetase n=1 Tax=Lentzea fradiae TaxID=200378 RepID=A0A1G7T926_9PSEU|nr:glutamine synthetase family protein [Lentzea fradiae]SDG31857.1 glutamine synthetase [Lentzea fradiae]
MDSAERDQRFDRATELFDGLNTRGVRAVAVTWVDNSGITRTKSVPLRKLAHAAAHGVGSSPVFDVFLLDDHIIQGRFAGGPVGDLRLHPDLDRLTVLAGQPGWAWAPGDRHFQDGAPYPMDQRLQARKAVHRLAERGLTAQAGFEIEWCVGRTGTDDWVPATSGPAYGHARQVELSDYCADLLDALDQQDVEVLQFHPEYAPGQFEVSTAPEDPVGAADTAVLVKETIRAVTMRHGMRLSFSPKVINGGVGNGGHLHFSLWRDGTNLFEGFQDEARRFSAGILAHLRALCAIGCPSLASYLRLVPQTWSAPFVAWGEENRETALRLIRDNMEIKCFDLTANPYLVVAGVIAAGLDGIATSAPLPEGLSVDPALLDGVPRLPTSLREAVDEFEQDAVLTEAFGKEFAGTIADVRRGEMERFKDASPQGIANITRWRY